MKAEPILEPEDLAKRRIGELLSGKWRLERLLGVGGMAAVFAAKHENNDRAAAIKILHLEASFNQEVKRRFLREGYIANKVQHVGAVAVLDDGVTDDGAAYIVMELCVGETLQEHLDRVGLADEATVLRWVDALLDVLALAHKESIVHRDLKPDNVFVLHDGGVKVLDFGIARIRGGLSDLKTQAGLVLGTPAFMPPEQARGQSARVDGRADLWALGAIMLAALTGKRVHTAKSPQECLFLAMTETAKPMSELAPEISPKIAAIIDKALEFEPEARWDDAAAMQSAVRAVLAAFVRDPTLLVKPAAAKPAWPPAPIVPGPPMSPRVSVPQIDLPPPAGEPESGMRMPASAGGLRKATPFPGSSSPTKIEPTPAAVEAATAASRAESVPARLSSSPPPPPLHLQVEARSLEAGSPLLETNRKRRRWGVVAMVVVLAAGSFGSAYAIQHSPELRVSLGIEPAPLLVAAPRTAVLAPLPAEAPQPSSDGEAVAIELGEEPEDAGTASVAASAASLHGSTAQKPKPLPKKPLPKKPLPKKKKHRY